MKRNNFVVIIFTVALLVLIFYKIDFSVLTETFKTFSYKIIPITVLLYIFTLYLRGLRWKRLLPDSNKYSTLNLSEIFTIGSMLNVYLPARAGDFYRAYLLGNKASENKMKIFASIILERIFDGIALFIILLTAVLAACRQPWIVKLTILAGFIFIFSVIAAYLIFKYNKTDTIFGFLAKLSDKHCPKLSGVLIKLKEYTNNFVSGFEPICNIRINIFSILLSLVIWIIECVIAYYVLIGFNISLNAASSLFIIGLTSFSTMIPSTSVFLGPYQYAYILALGIFGVSKSATLAIATVHQSILILVLTIAGLILALKYNLSLKQLNKQN